MENSWFFFSPCSQMKFEKHYQIFMLSGFEIYLKTEQKLLIIVSTEKCTNWYLLKDVTWSTNSTILDTVVTLCWNFKFVVQSFVFGWIKNVFFFLRAHSEPLVASRWLNTLVFNFFQVYWHIVRTTKKDILKSFEIFF